MAKDAANINLSEMPGNSRCQWSSLHTRSRRLEVPYLDYLLHRLLPPNDLNAANVRKKLARFVVNEGILFRGGFNQVPLRCIAGEEITTFLREVHSGECGTLSGLEAGQTDHAPQILLADNGSWFLFVCSKVPGMPASWEHDPRPSCRIAQFRDSVAIPHLDFWPHRTHQSPFSR